jgi:hypothetical protein
MPAPVIAFVSAVAGRREAGGVAIALLDGATDLSAEARRAKADATGDAPERTCVAILLCSDGAARELSAAIAALPQGPAA